jgi:hypothetical protein
MGMVLVGSAGTPERREGKGADFRGGALFNGEDRKHFSETL